MSHSLDHLVLFLTLLLSLFESFLLADRVAIKHPPLLVKGSRRWAKSSNQTSSSSSPLPSPSASNECTGSTRLEHLHGTCLYHYECVAESGVSIGHCWLSRHTLTVGSCCMLNQTTTGTEVQSKHIASGTASGNNLLSSKPSSGSIVIELSQRRTSLKTVSKSTTSLPSSSPALLITLPDSELDSTTGHELDFYEIISSNTKTTNRPGNSHYSHLVPPTIYSSVGSIPLNNPPRVEDVYSNHFPVYHMIPTSGPAESVNSASSPGMVKLGDSSRAQMPTTPAMMMTTTTTTSNSKKPTERRACGIRPLRPTGRVVGGRNAQFGEWPWQVLVKESTWLGFFMKAKCGGVLIDYKWVLTAAHCQPGMMGSLVVMLGQHELHGHTQQLKPMVKPVKRMIVHRDYNPDTFDNDIALLELETPFEMQPHIVPICLPEEDEDYVGQFAFVAGWGKLSYGGFIPSILQTVRLPIIDSHVCQKMFADAGHYKYIRDSALCAGYSQGGKDTCEGDSGGPLMLERGGVWTLIGTVSHGIKCAEPNMPGVYMKTYAYLNWIRSIVDRL